MNDTDTDTDGVGITGTVYTAVFDMGHVRSHHPEWDDMDDRAQLRALRSCDFVNAGVVHNATLAGFHDYLADSINPESNANENVADLAVGTGTSTPASTDTGLDNELGTVTLTDAATVDNTVTFNYVIDSTQFNGNTLAEVSVTGTNDAYWNRALISPTVAKDDTKTVVVDVELTFDTA